MLYICATPIGNLEDITLRVLNTLKEVDYIACEDTRRTVKLLNHYNITKKLVSVNEHTEYDKKDAIIKDLEAGMNVALVSDAGMPGIQDPGRLIIEQAIAHKIPYTVLPGATALVTALVGSGLCKDEFLFLGFLPRKKQERISLLKKYSEFDREIVVYEAPHRLEKLLDSLWEVFGNRKIVISRELSKKYEEYIFTDIEEAIKKHSTLKGELVIIIERKQETSEDDYEEEDIYQLAHQFYAQGLKTKEIASRLVDETHISKNKAYEMALDISNKLTR